MTVVTWLRRGEPVASHEWLARTLARTIHKLSTAAARSSVLTARPAAGAPSLDLLGVLQEYACGGLGRDVAQRTPAGAFAASRRQPVNNSG